MMTKKAKKQVDLQIKLRQYTTEYLAMEREKEAYYVRNVRDRSRTVIVTLYLMQENIDSIIKKICTTVNKMVREDIDIDNEVALQIYSEYEPAIRRGLSDLL